MKEADSLRYVLIGCIVIHVGLAVFEFLSINLLHMVWQLAYGYCAVWCYMGMNRCVIYLYMFALCWQIVEDVFGLLGGGNFLLELAEIALICCIIYMLWGKMNEFNKALSQVKNKNYA